MFHLVTYCEFWRSQYIPKLGGIYKNWGFYLELCLTVKNQWELLGGSLTCEELVNEVNHTTECVTDLLSFEWAEL